MARNDPTERPEEQWHPARLIPVAGTWGAKEQEQRATSALLAVMGDVPSFGKAILSYLGAPAGHISTYTEVPFEDKDGPHCHPATTTPISPVAAPASHPTVTSGLAISVSRWGA